ncbi:MAG: aminoglycoside phosphotransferase family protein [Deltaproteobacteria bacterium]|nr:aminoglycoside phosphotransferase family protein [Deltaproteobacteria bacterium]
MNHQPDSLPSPFTQAQLAAAFAPFLDSPVLRVEEVLTGNINTILRVRVGEQRYGLRVRTHESVYRYEPDLIKEVFVLRVLQQSGSVPDDAAIAATFAQLTAARCGTLSQGFAGVPVVRYFDWSRARLPQPYCIYEWVEGQPLWDTPEPTLYAATGQTLAGIHQARFSAFYADFLSVGISPVSWLERFQAALAKEINAARGRLPRRVNEALLRLRPSVVADCSPCLVHNDFAPGNILVRDGRIAAVIDWDNAVVEAPHLDFVKMKYWTAKNAAGALVPEPTLFAAFVDGYGEAGRRIVASPTFLFYEVLWLLRVYNFECAKEEQGLPRAPGYPAAATYAELIAAVTEGTPGFPLSLDGRGQGRG